MKALVLCGGVPQIALLQYLRELNITTVLADMNEKVGGRAYADIFYSVSVLDVEGVKQVAVQEKVDFVITVCADQVLEVVARVSEELGLPCYIDRATAENVSNKSYMKRVFVENQIPTSRHIILSEWNATSVAALSFPLIVKPVDAYSSRGVKKVTSAAELEDAFRVAAGISRAGNVVIEEFVEGDEVTVDVYVENGKAHLLCLSHLDKIGEDGKFVIHRTRFPAQLSACVTAQITATAQKIADAFGLVNSPMLIQLIVHGEQISVVEFCARTGGGDKFRLIEKAAGFNVVHAVADLTRGLVPHVGAPTCKPPFIVNEFVYCSPGVFDRLEGFEELLDEAVISEYFQLKSKGTALGAINSSGDRVAYFTVEGDSLDEVRRKHALASARIKALDSSGRDLIRHDLIEKEW